MMRLATIAAMLWLSLAAAPAQNISEQYLLAAANHDRTDNGLGPLRLDAHLALAARMHAYEMAQRLEISHQFAGEKDLARRAGDAGAHFSLITENVAEAASASRMHELWMKSAGHRLNLLDPQVNAVGIAVIQRNGQLYAVEDFGRTVAVLSIAEQEAQVGALLTEIGLRLDPVRGDVRQTCTMTTGYAGSRQPWFVMRYSSSSLDKLPAQLTSQVATHRYHEAAVGACVTGKQEPFTTYSVAVMLFP
jgi:hypothetical protein